MHCVPQALNNMAIMPGNVVGYADFTSTNDQTFFIKSQLRSGCRTSYIVNKDGNPLKCHLQTTCITSQNIPFRPLNPL